MLASDEELRDSLDGISAAARWLAEHHTRLSTEEERMILKNVATAVTQGVEDQIVSQDDPGILASDLAIVEGLASTLKLDFSQEIRWLNERLSELGSPEDVDVGAPGQGHRPSEACAVSIESMFDALLE